MRLAPHFSLVSPDRRILSSYDADGRSGGQRSELVPLADRPNCQLVSWAAATLLALHLAAVGRGWDLRITEAVRPVEVQARARRRYLAARLEGRSAPYVAPPGRSGHGAGLSVDIHTGPLERSGATLAAWHTEVRLRGWRPIVPTSGGWAQSESWHLDCWGPLEGIRRRQGYAEATMAGHLLTGQWDHLLDQGWTEERVAVAVAQAGLQRAGVDCGQIDGVSGVATQRALLSVGADLTRPWVDVAAWTYTLGTDLGQELAA